MGNAQCAANGNWQLEHQNTGGVLRHQNALSMAVFGYRSSLFCSFAISLFRSFDLYKKSNKEQFALLLFTKRATKSVSLFHSLPKE